MKHLELTSIRKTYGGVVAVNEVTLQLEKGERISLLGPSGCGKTTLLNIVAGFLRPDSGSVVVNGHDITNHEAYKRNIGVVFQNYALFPHMTVRENVYFGLRMRQISRSNAAPTIAKAIELVRLTGLEDRYPSQLSGGQQQRVAIARALAIQPQLLCLDEPLSNLDAKLREEMRTDLIEILNELSTTTIFVTHDQSEALSLSNRVAILNRGRVEQVDTPERVYEFPATHFVANFLGEGNRFFGSASSPHGDKRREIRLEGGVILKGRSTVVGSDGRSTAYVRADRIEIGLKPLRTDNYMTGTLRHVVYLGNSVRLIVDTAIQRIVVQVSGTQSVVTKLTKDSQIHIGWSADDTIILPGEMEG